MAQDQLNNDIPSISTANSGSSKLEPHLSDQIQRWELAVMAGIEKSLQETIQSAKDFSNETLTPAAETIAGAVMGNQADQAKVAQAAAEAAQALENMPQTAENIYQALTNPALYEALQAGLANQKEALQAAYTRGDVEAAGMIIGVGMTDFLGPGKGKGVKKALDAVDEVELDLSKEIVAALMDGADSPNNTANPFELFETMEKQLGLVDAGKQSPAGGVKAIYQVAGIDSHESAIRAMYKKKNMELPDDPDNMMLDAMRKNMEASELPPELDDKIKKMAMDVFSEPDAGARGRKADEYLAGLAANRVSRQAVQELERQSELAGKVAGKHIRDIQNALDKPQSLIASADDISTNKLAVVAASLAGGAYLATLDWNSEAEKNADLANRFTQAVNDGPEDLKALAQTYKELGTAADQYKQIESHLGVDGSLNAGEIYTLQEVAATIAKQIREQGPESFEAPVKQSQINLTEQGGVEDKSADIDQDREPEL